MTALNALGIHDVDVLTARGLSAVGSPIHSTTTVHLDHDASNPGDLRRSHAITRRGRVPLAGFLAEHDIVVNCVLQDSAAPLTFLIEDDLAAFSPGSLIVDVSCDEGMGFSWARPTTFTKPTFPVGDGITYYAVDHSPSYLRNSATWEISEALLPYLRSVLSGQSTWDDDETVRRAVEIRDGTIRNPAVLSFQHRSPEYPHRRCRTRRNRPTSARGGCPTPEALRDGPGVRAPAFLLPQPEPAAEQARQQTLQRHALGTPHSKIIPERPASLHAPQQDLNSYTEWNDFLLLSPWFANNRQCMSDMVAAFRKTGRCAVAGYGITQDSGAVSQFGPGKTPWIFNSIFCPYTVQQGPDGLPGQNITWRDEFRALQHN